MSKKTALSLLKYDKVALSLGGKPQNQIEIYHQNYQHSRIYSVVCLFSQYLVSFHRNQKGCDHV